MYERDGGEGRGGERMGKESVQRHNGVEEGGIAMQELGA